jgi:hypothetical protein
MLSDNLQSSWPTPWMLYSAPTHWILDLRSTLKIFYSRFTHAWSSPAHMHLYLCFCTINWHEHVCMHGISVWYPGVSLPPTSHDTKMRPTICTPAVFQHSLHTSLSVLVHTSLSVLVHTSLSVLVHTSLSANAFCFHSRTTWSIFSFPFYSTSQVRFYKSFHACIYIYILWQRCPPYMTHVLVIAIQDQHWCICVLCILHTHSYIHHSPILDGAHDKATSYGCKPFKSV